MEPPVSDHVMPKLTSMAAPRVWVLTDSVVGHASQSLGVAEALGRPFETRTVVYGPLARIPGLLGPGSLCGIDAASRAGLTPPWPEAVIATGRRLGSIARWIKRRAAKEGQRVFLAQMMDPVRGRQEFDLIAAPQHDGLAPRANLIETLGAPTRVTAERLAEAAHAWDARLRALPSPRIALLVGGSAGRRVFTPAQARELGRLASDMAVAAGGSLMVTTSRRTGEAATDALVAAIAAPSYIHRWAPAGENPYYALLGLADAVIVTGESISMASEAAAAGKPLFVYAPPELVKPAFARFHQALYAQGFAQPLTAGMSLAAAPTAKLESARIVAAEIRRRMNPIQ